MQQRHVLLIQPEQSATLKRLLHHQGGLGVRVHPRRHGTGLGHAGSGRLVARRGVRDRRRPRRLDRLLDRPPARRGRRGPADAGVLPAVESGSGGLSGRRS